MWFTMVTPISTSSKSYMYVQFLSCHAFAVHYLLESNKNVVHFLYIVVGAANRTTLFPI